MFRKLFFVIAAGLIFVSCEGNGLKSEDMTEFNKLDWMLGIWQGKQGEADLYESWRQKNFRILEGVSFTTQKGKRLYGQSMRIEQSNNKIFMIISYGDNDKTTLTLQDVSEEHAVFTNENKEEFPAKVVYRESEDNSMSVVVMGESAADSAKFVYQKTSDK